MVSFIRFFLMAFMCLLPAIIVLGTTSADLYRIMGVTPDADAGVIKRAYHKLSLKWHPDKNTSPEAEQMFMLIAQAYEILGDIDKRRQYDNSGDSQQQQQQQQQRKRTTDIDLESPVVMQMNFEGGLFSFDYRPPPRVKSATAGNIVASADCSLHDLYTGFERNVSYSKQKICPVCGGHGAGSPQHIVACPICKGTGRRSSFYVNDGVVMSLNHTCHTCEGTGKKTEEYCPRCMGAKVVNEVVNTSLHVHKGAPLDYTITLPGQGDESPNVAPGNVLIRLNVLSHANFTRDKDDLVHRVNITLFEALLGFHYQLEHLANRTINITQDSVSQLGGFLTIEDEGMPIPFTEDQFGDLRIMLNIKFPTSLSPEEKLLLRSVLDEGEIAKLEATIERKALLTGFQDFLRPIGNDPVFHKSEDVTSNVFVLLVDAPLSAPGRVVEWIFAAVRECELAFQVWRPGPNTPRHFKADSVNGVFIKQANSANGAAHNYSLVGESKISMRHKGVYQVPLQPHQFIHVRPGDVLGFISYYPACFAVDISSPQFIRISDTVKSATFPGDVVAFPGIINTLFPVSAKIQGVPLVYSGSGCTGPYAALYDDSSNLCEIFFPDGSATNDVVTSILVPPFLRLELFPECAQPTGTPIPIEHRGVNEARCVSVGAGTSHVVVVR